MGSIDSVRHFIPYERILYPSPAPSPTKSTSTKNSSTATSGTPSAQSPQPSPAGLTPKKPRKTKFTSQLPSDVKIDPNVCRLASGKYQCPACKSAYIHFKHLIRHLRRHTGYRPYVCQVCNDTFSRSDILKRHMDRCLIRKMSEPKTRGQESLPQTVKLRPLKPIQDPFEPRPVSIPRMRSCISLQDCTDVFHQNTQSYPETISDPVPVTYSNHDTPSTLPDFETPKETLITRNESEFRYEYEYDPPCPQLTPTMILPDTLHPPSPPYSVPPILTMSQDILTFEFERPLSEPPTNIFAICPALLSLAQ